MMALELLGVVRPTLRGESPQLAREPRVEHVFVLMHMMAAAFRAHVHVFHARVFPTAIGAVEHRDAMAPPQLAGDAPVFQVFHPG